MSMFRIVKYSTILFFLGKYKTRLFRMAAVLLFALVTSLLYQDVVDYLELRHPETVFYALIAKVVIVYGALGFVLLQFRPQPGDSSPQKLEDIKDTPTAKTMPKNKPNDRLAALEDVSRKTTLQSRYDRLLDGDDDSSPE